METKVCFDCKIEKDLKEYPIYKINHGISYRRECKKCRHNRYKDKINKNKHNKYNPSKKQEYYEKNKVSIKARTAKRHKERRKQDILYRLADYMRSRVRHALKNAEFIKETKFKEYIGCTLEELKLHLEKQFQPGMTWENYSLHGWHIDHIIPLSSAQSEAELYKLCHYTNLQPLWAIENIRKGAKIV